MSRGSSPLSTIQRVSKVSVGYVVKEVQCAIQLQCCCRPNLAPYLFTRHSRPPLPGRIPLPQPRRLVQQRIHLAKPVQVLLDLAATR